MLFYGPLQEELEHRKTKTWPWVAYKGRNLKSILAPPPLRTLSDMGDEMVVDQYFLFNQLNLKKLKEYISTRDHIDTLEFHNICIDCYLL